MMFSLYEHAKMKFRVMLEKQSWKTNIYDARNLPRIGQKHIVMSMLCFCTVFGMSNNFEAIHLLQILMSLNVRLCDDATAVAAVDTAPADEKIAAAATIDFTTAEKVPKRTFSYPEIFYVFCVYRVTFGMGNNSWLLLFRLKKNCRRAHISELVLLDGALYELTACRRSHWAVLIDYFSVFVDLRAWFNEERLQALMRL